MKIKVFFASAIVGSLFLVSCGGDAPKEEVNPKEETVVEETVVEDAAEEGGMSNKGVGPITSMEIAESIDEALAAKGEEIFTSKCTACHKMDARYVGPPLQGITNKRSPEWIMNMILAPEKMVAEDPDAKALLAEYLAPMANQNLTEDEARAILEYFRTEV